MTPSCVGSASEGASVGDALVPIEVPPEALRVYARALDAPLCAWTPGPPLLDEQAVRRILPHRHPFLFTDRVLSFVDGVAVCGFTLQPDDPVFAGHFPGRPRWPGVLQIEAVAQAGLLAAALSGSPNDDPHLCHVLAARYRRPVLPGPIVTLGMSVDAGLFGCLVGQLIQDGEICSTVMLTLL